MIGEIPLIVGFGTFVVVLSVSMLGLYWLSLRVRKVYKDSPRVRLNSELLDSMKAVHAEIDHTDSWLNDHLAALQGRRKSDESLQNPRKP